MTLVAVAGEHLEYEETAIAVNDATTTIQTINIPRVAKTCVITVKNSHASGAWDTFIVALRPTTNAPFVTHASLAANFTSPTDPLKWASGSPVTLGAAASRSFCYDVTGIDAIQLQAGGAGAVSTAEVYFHFGE